jgi:hypothetical protein
MIKAASRNPESGFSFDTKVLEGPFLKLHLMTSRALFTGHGRLPESGLFSRLRPANHTPLIMN